MLRPKRSMALVRHAETVLRQARREPTWSGSVNPVAEDLEVGVFLPDRWRDSAGAADNPPSMRQHGESGRKGEGADPKNGDGLRE